jgi:hypothetical protein
LELVPETDSLNQALFPTFKLPKHIKMLKLATTLFTYYPPSSQTFVDL